LGFDLQRKIEHYFQLPILTLLKLEEGHLPLKPKFQEGKLLVNLVKTNLLKVKRNFLEDQ